jgi:type II secretory pathway component PulJ
MKRNRFNHVRIDLQADLKRAMDIVVKRAKAATELRIKRTKERMRAMGLRA